MAIYNCSFLHDGDALSSTLVTQSIHVCTFVQSHVELPNNLEDKLHRLDVLQTIDPDASPDELSAEQQQFAPTAFLHPTWQMSLAIWEVCGGVLQMLKVYHHCKGGNISPSSDCNARSTDPVHMPFNRDRWNGLKSAKILASDCQAKAQVLYFL